MSNFSDREDRDLVQLTAAYEIQNQKIVWSDVVHKMRYSKKKPRVLQQRLTTLKNTYGKSLQGFPERFFRPLLSHPGVQKQPVKNVKAPAEITKLPGTAQQVESDAHAVARAPLESSDTKGNGLKIPRASTSRSSISHADPAETTTLTNEAAFAAIHQIFGPVRKTDVLQAAGRVETNVGELSPRGTSKLIGLCNLHPDDVFVDVGSGIGNIVAQVAIQTTAKLVIGLEMRAELVCLSRQLVADGKRAFPALSRIKLVEGDIAAEEVGESVITQATVIFANNLLFTPTANQALHVLCSELPYLRLVLLIDRPCPRHRARCSNPFCSLWKESGKRRALETEFRSCPLEVIVYERRVRKNNV